MRVNALISRIFKEMIRDKRTLALMFIAPLFIMTLIFFLFQSNTNTKADLGVRGVDTSVVRDLDTDRIRLHHVGKEDPTMLIKDHDYAGILTQKGNKLTLLLANADQGKSALLKQGLQAATIKLKMQAAATTIKNQATALQKLASALQHSTRGTAQVAGSQPASTATHYRIATYYRYGSANSTYFDTLLPILIGFIVFFFVFLISGIALLRERTTGTLDRLLATPVRRGEIISGYLLGYGIFAVIQTILIVGYALFVFKIQILGSIAAIFLINLLLAITALSLGLLISTFANTEFQMLQFIPLVVVPQIFFTGLIPVNQMLGWLQPIARLMPLYYGADALTGIIAKGQSLSVLYPDVIALLGFFLLFLSLNLVTMRHYRQV
ncbi:ABC transporter permease [Lacticaseibacillus zeae]|uniref:ABC transporter permease n=1 Tax=Lacticaseibacillus zeae subsp. silagei TaxID=3068307 RepID=A0ABD7ZCK3_LACZE|nr:MULTISPECIES: ABC transporter permease [Lacticaseibacillus]MDE3314861.1 ABC transporter permease [Lacticaseibacillus zeae]OFS00206.1 ABC transporter permease [Lactobacillus sp. HMSC068F07]WLV84467.1 ABC transporter permease [Lacticaseibacillus sp. NCIMB 15475]WLV87223.1 ABC transporter permease [Lacticaseibacillus sp. NCIMB 15474]